MELTSGGTDHGQPMFRFTTTATGEELLAEQPVHFWWPGPRLFTPSGNGYHRLEQMFRAYDGERLFGLGQHVRCPLFRERNVYLPAGASWTSAWPSAVHAGGTVARAEAPLGQIPLFLRDGAALPI